MFEGKQQIFPEYCVPAGYVPLHPLSNIKITKYFNYEPRFNGVFSRDNLLRIKDGVYIRNLDEKQSKGIHWVSLFIDRNTAYTLILLGLNIFHKKY